MTKRWFASAGVILGLVLVVFFVGYSSGSSPTSFFFHKASDARSVCGNGVVDGREQCDDGNTARGDGCFRCRIETGRVPGICGDGVLNLGEECDDSNIILGDGCSERCLSESSTWQCDDRDNWDGDEGEATTNIWMSNSVQTRRSSSERWALTQIFVDGNRVQPRDVCLGPNTLREFYCHTTDDRPAYSELNCEYGCSNGACNPLPCSDSDGNDVLTSGSVTGVFRGSNSGRGADPAVLGLSSSAQTYEDGCYGVRVREMTCASNGFVSGSLRDCPSGQVCSDGRCSPIPPPPEPEVCDGIDNDRDGTIDEGCDDDNDGVCDASMEFVSSTCGASIYPWNSNCCHTGGDCSDNSALVSPWRSESCADNLDNDCNDIVNDGCEGVCDDIDNNGNGLVDDGCDNDGDSYCRSSYTVIGTPAVCPNGGGDCWDVDYANRELESIRELAASINPGVTENCFTDYDDNCNGQTNEGCSGPYVCEETDVPNDPVVGGYIVISSGNGQEAIWADICIGPTATNQTLCRSSSSPVYGQGLGSLRGSVLVDCPSGTTCSDPDGPSGPIPAVCS